MASAQAIVDMTTNNTTNTSADALDAALAARQAQSAGALAARHRVDAEAAVGRLVGARVRLDPDAGAMEPTSAWARLERAAPHVRRALLYGPPGTGKSYLARTAGLGAGAVYPIVVHADLPAAELRGHFIPQASGGLVWADGPAVAAWRTGGRLVLDEIDKAGDDALSFLLGVLDDLATAKLALGTTGEVLSPHPAFTVWATMNGEPEDLPPALQDRFPVTVRITEPHPAAIAALPGDLRPLARSLAAPEGEDRRMGLRPFIESARPRALIAADDAGSLIFSGRWDDLRQAITLAGKADQR